MSLTDPPAVSSRRRRGKQRAEYASRVEDLVRLGLPEFLAERYVGAVYFGYGFDVAWEWWVVVPLGSVGALLILPSLGPFRPDGYFVGGCALVGAALTLIGWYLVRLPATRRRRLAARQWLREIDAQYNLNSSK